MSLLPELEIWLSRYANHLAVVLTAIAIGVAGSIIMPLFRKPLDVKGKHCYITGGSTGLGKALAVQLLRRGAHVTIVARDPKKLAEAERELKIVAGPGQIVQTVSADLTKAATSNEALDKASKAHGGKVPDHIYLCAGFSKPKFMIDSTEDEFQGGLDGTYWVSAWTARAAVQRMVAQKVQGRIVFVSSLLGYASFVGYTNYSPGKYALRGLADALRSEMLLHKISVHIFMPAGIDSPGFVEEEKEKPKVTRKIEEDDTQISPEECAKHLLTGIEKGYYQFTSHLIADLIRVVSKGSAPFNNPFYDGLLYIIATPGVQIWRWITDRQVKGFRKELDQDLQDRGYYSSF